MELEDSAANDAEMGAPERGPSLWPLAVVIAALIGALVGYAVYVYESSPATGATGPTASR